MIQKYICKSILLCILFCHSAFCLDEKSLTVLLENSRLEMNLPGVRAAVKYPGGKIIRTAVGLSDKNTKKLLDNDIGMPGGSTGKTFVAVLVLLLVEDGILTLDDPVKKWLDNEKWFNQLPNSDLILVRHLLSHSSGLGDYPDKMRFKFNLVKRNLQHGSAYFEPEELIGFVQKKPLFLPGKGYAYTDAGYLILGRVIEKATGSSYYKLLQKRLLLPLGLDKIRHQNQSILANITPGYQGGVSNLRKDGRMKFDPRSEWTGGGLVTNPTMLVRFYSDLIEGNILKPISLSMMFQSGWRNPKNSDFYYGLGLFIDHNGDWLGHGGLWPGYRTQVTHFKSTGITIAVQTNRDGRVDMIKLVTRIADMARTTTD